MTFIPNVGPNLYYKLETDLLTRNLPSDEVNRLKRIRKIAQEISPGGESDLAVCRNDSTSPVYSDAKILDEMGIIQTTNWFLNQKNKINIESLRERLLLDTRIQTEAGKAMARIRKDRMIDLLLNLAEESSLTYPLEARELLHPEVNPSYFGSTTIFNLGYVPKTFSFFQRVLRDKYGMLMAGNLKETIIIQGILNPSQIQSLIYQYLPNPRVLLLTERYVGGDFLTYRNSNPDSE